MFLQKQVSGAASGCRRARPLGRLTALRCHSHSNDEYITTETTPQRTRQGTTAGIRGAGVSGAALRLVGASRSTGVDRNTAHVALRRAAIEWLKVRRELVALGVGTAPLEHVDAALGLAWRAAIRGTLGRAV